MVHWSICSFSTGFPHQNHETQSIIGGLFFKSPKMHNQYQMKEWESNELTTYEGRRSHCCLAPKSCLTLGDPMGCRLPGFSVHGIFPGKNTGVDSHFLLQGIFQTQGSNLSLLSWQADSLNWATREANCSR